MPEKFTQVNAPCKDCLVAPACQDKVKIEEEMSHYDLFEFFLVLQKWDESKKMYRKGLIEAWVQMGREIVFNAATDKIEGIPEEAQPVYMNSLIELAATLEWMVNSTSWKRGHEYDFDIAEVKTKLKQAIGWL